VALLDIPPAVKHARAFLRRRGGGLAYRCDVHRETDVRQAFWRVYERCHQIDFLINNAGIEGPTAPLEKISLPEWERTMAVNVTGAFLCAREAARWLRRSDQGSVIQIGSVAGRIAYPLRLPYAASKAALESLTRTLAVELGPIGVRVNLVAPGPIQGKRMERLIQKRARALGESERTVREGYLKAMIVRRLIPAAEVVRAVLFLCSPGAGSITGQTIEVSGGWTTGSLQQ
jgi:NAD(P)-dependent dehydrogenase (short-subunit alcohol dehydrogenase family)